MKINLSQQRQVFLKDEHEHEYVCNLGIKRLYYGKVSEMENTARHSTMVHGSNHST
jgi:hypothetical protein